MKTTELVPQPQNPESRLIVYKRDLPNPRRKIYQTVLENKTSSTTWNYQENELREISISGKELVFDPDEKDGLFENLIPDKENPPANIKRLRIYGETVTILGVMHLPQATVEIFARCLIFEDKANKPKTCVKTTPLNKEESAVPASAKGPAGNGVDGLKGGTITLNIKELRAGKGIRFDTSGGVGQAGGVGLAGTQGHCVASRVPPIRGGSFPRLGEVFATLCENCKSTTH